jgi:hypothetical protein
MNKSDAKNILRGLAKYGKVAYSDHSIEQMLKRSITTEDILYVLMWGKIKSIERDITRQNWKCKIIGEDLDGEELTVLAAICSELETVIVTVF